MNILHVIASMEPKTGGPCQGIRNSIPELEKHNVYREVVTVDDPKADFLGKDEFPIHALGPAKNPWGYTPKLIPWLNENICRFDKVIVNGLWLFPGYAVRKVLHRLHKHSSIDCPNFFVMPHGMLDPYFQNAGHRKLKAVRNWFYWKLIEKKIIEEAEAILFTCQLELELARTTFQPYQPKKEINVGYGIGAPPVFSENMKEAFYKSFSGLDDEPYLLFFSRIHHKKGVDILIEAYRQILVNSNKIDIPKLVIAGPGLDTVYGKKMSSIVKNDNDLNKNIFFTGMLSGEAKWGALYCCDAFILPSHQENFGIAIVEALACGKMVLISNKINICKEIERANAGYLTEDNIIGVKKLLEKWLIMKEVDKIAYGKKALACYEENFTIKAASENFLAALKIRMK